MLVNFHTFVPPVRGGKGGKTVEKNVEVKVLWAMYLENRLAVLTAAMTGLSLRRVLRLPACALADDGSLVAYGCRWVLPHPLARSLRRVRDAMSMFPHRDKYTACRTWQAVYRDCRRACAAVGVPYIAPTALARRFTPLPCYPMPGAAVPVVHRRRHGGL